MLQSNPQSTSASTGQSPANSCFEHVLKGLFIGRIGLRLHSPTRASTLSKTRSMQHYELILCNGASYKHTQQTKKTSTFYKIDSDGHSN